MLPYLETIVTVGVSVVAVEHVDIVYLLHKAYVSQVLCCRVLCALQY